MSDVNVVVLTGNMTRDAEVRYTPNGTPVSNFSLASNRSYKREGERVQDTTFVDCVLWGKAAEALAEYMTKGRRLEVRGRLSQNSWEDKETGARRSRTEVICDEVNFTPGWQKSQSESEPEQEPVAASADSGDDVPF